jgi:hypothetical protein
VTNKVKSQNRFTPAYYDHQHHLTLRPVDLLGDIGSGHRDNKLKKLILRLLETTLLIAYSLVLVHIDICHLCHIVICHLSFVSYDINHGLCHMT